ncbi:hypothetical protein [Streptomyces phaeochromogenes]|uniref:hypothetical protein n=1 Tax=Streptomyces phaeochromogenes TaxID=1923 RepID=UPI0036B3A293
MRSASYAAAAARKVASATLSEGSAFEVFLDHWWTQSLADRATDADAKDLAIDFADLAIALRSMC